MNQELVNIFYEIADIKDVLNCLSAEELKRVLRK